MDKTNNAAAEKAAQEAAKKATAEKAAAEKKFDSNAAKEKADKLFKSYPEAKALYFAPDGTAFFKESDAVNHSKSKNNIVKIEK